MAAAAPHEPRHPLAPATHVPNSTAPTTPRRAKPAASPRHAPASSSPRVHPLPASPPPGAVTAATTRTRRSLSVSFQGESFVYDSSPRASPRPAAPRRGGEPENETPRRRRAPAANAKPRARAPDALALTLSCSLHRKESILAAVRLLRTSMAHSSRSTSPRSQSTAPATFWQDTNSRLRRRSFSDCPTSPSRIRGNHQQDEEEARAPGNAPSIISFATAVRRGNKGEDKIEEAHRLRLLDSRHLQWRCANAIADAAILARSSASEKALHCAWKDISVLRNSVSFKRSTLHLQKQKLKLFAILKGQISYLEEWSHIENDHSSSMSQAIKALEASTIRLPIVGGAKVDAQGLSEVISSSVVGMNTMASSMRSLLSKVEGTSSLVFELAKIASQEQMLLEQTRDIFSAVAVMHVKQCALQAHLLQGKRKHGQMQL